MTKLATSRIMFVNFVTIEYISDWFPFVFKLIEFWVRLYSIFSEQRSQFVFLSFHFVVDFLYFTWLWYWIPIGQWSLSLYAVSTCQSNYVVELVFVIVRSITDKFLFETLCLVGLLLFSRLSVSSFKNSSIICPLKSVWVHPYKVFRLLKSPKRM